MSVRSQLLSQNFDFKVLQLKSTGNQAANALLWPEFREQDLTDTEKELSVEAVDVKNVGNQEFLIN